MWGYDPHTQSEEKFKEEKMNKIRKLKKYDCWLRIEGKNIGWLEREEPTFKRARILGTRFVPSPNYDDIEMCLVEHEDGTKSEVSRSELYKQYE